MLASMAAATLKWRIVELEAKGSMGLLL